MLENALELRKISYKTKITCKAAVTAALAILAVILPQIVHMAAGANGGARWLPMYLPILIGGCLLGAKWGLALGISAPLLSFAVTTLAGNAMPSAERLPLILGELAVFAVISGLFTKKIFSNALWAFPAVLLAQLAGRATFAALSVIVGGSFGCAEIALRGIQASIPGLAAQAVLVPLVIMILRKALIKER